MQLSGLKGNQTNESNRRDSNVILVAAESCVPILLAQMGETNWKMNDGAKDRKSDMENGVRSEMIMNMVTIMSICIAYHMLAIQWMPYN